MYLLTAISVLLLVSVSCRAQSTNCNGDCMMGTFKSNQTSNPNCTWSCERCPLKTISTTNNAKNCTRCKKGFVANPQRTKCDIYKSRVYDLSRPTGIIYVILLVVFIFFILFAFIVVCKNCKHEMVVLSNEAGLFIYLFGCVLIAISPIPLLLEPVSALCGAYVCVFNLGLTAVFAVLITRSSYIMGYYDDQNEVIKSGMGSSPRAVVFGVALLIQIIILVAGFSIKQVEMSVMESEVWNVGYFECSVWNNYVFWAAFFYNVFLSCFGNFISCSSTNMNEICEELKYVLMTYLVFYVVAIVEIILFFRVRNEMLAEGQAIVCILYALAFYVCYLLPKLHVILFRTKDDGVSIKDKVHTHDDEAAVTSLIHAKNGYQHRVVQMKVRDA